MLRAQHAYFSLPAKAGKLLLVTLSIWRRVRRLMSGDKKIGTINPTQQTPEIRIRPLVESDLPSVLEIERASFPSPWKSEFFLSELNNSFARLVVAEEAGKVLGYFCRWLVADEVHVLDIAVHPGYRRRGIGKTLLQEILNEARQHDAHSVSLEVRVSNQPALALYQAFGFCQVATRQRYYENGEDALLMTCALSEPTTVKA